MSTQAARSGRLDAPLAPCSTGKPVPPFIFYQATLLDFTEASNDFVPSLFVDIVGAHDFEAVTDFAPKHDAYYLAKIKKERLSDSCA